MCHCMKVHFPLFLIQIFSKNSPYHCEPYRAKQSHKIFPVKWGERLLRQKEHPPRNDGKVLLKPVLVSLTLS
jgi:hypothetical protein